MGVVLTVFTVQAVEWTGDDKFCGMCHIMTRVGRLPFRQAQGHNHVGMKAECVDCHLPHDNIIHYFVEKTLLGMEDVYGNTMKNPRKFDWEMNHAEAKNYVFDSVACVATLI